MIELYDENDIKHHFFTAKLFNQNIQIHRHSFWEVSYCINGELTHWINEKPFKTHANSDIILIKPGDSHRITHTPLNSAASFHRDIYITPAKMKMCCDLLSPTLYKELLERSPIIIDGSKNHLEYSESQLHFFDKFDSLSKIENDILDKIHTAVIFQILSIYFNRILQKPTYPTWLNEFFLKLKNEENLCKNVSELAKLSNYSPAYLSREFKKHTGKTIIQYLNENRILYSTFLLLNPENTILAIAMRLNYSSQSAYCNAFKKVYNMSPREWRHAQFNN